MTGRYVLVGVADNDNDRSDDSGIGNAAIAYINDNGSAKLNIPARPFMVVGVQQSLPKATAALKSYAKQALTKRDPSKIEQGMAAAGMIARDSVKKRITSQEGFAPLASSTLAGRAGAGFSGTKALIRTGSLLNSITYVVKKRNG
tara:strand:- start:41 stop:475 length:435 start_codon:yes stop_codon:yes gene_type:complete